MEDILSVYKRPYEKDVPVVCMDETSKQLIKEMRLPIQMQPGQAACYDTEYERNGTCNIFLYVEPLTGKRGTQVTEQRRRTDWAHFIRDLVDNHFMKPFLRMKQDGY
jgi:hypothetical protein